MHKTHKPLPIPIRLGATHRKLLYAVFLAAWLSGALWLVFHYFLQAEGDFGPLTHPAEKWWLRLHGLSVFGMLIALGSVLPVHARRAWQLGKNRKSGLGMKLVFGWMALTGYALYYFASEENQAWLPVLHWAAGLGLPLVLLIHISLGRRRAHPRQIKPKHAESIFQS
jgi:hypothetical protein